MAFLNKKILTPTLLLVLGLTFLSTPALAAGSCGGVETSIVSCSEDGGNAIWSILEIAVNVLAGLIGIVAVGGLVYGAVLYSSAGDNAGQVTKSKTTIANVVIGLVLFAGMYSFIQFLIPGGVFGRDLNAPVASNTPTERVGGSESDKEDNPVKATDKIVHLHSSGRFDRSVSQWRKDLQTFKKKYSPTVITLTETASGRSSVIDWKGWSHTKGETSVAWDTTVWKKTNSEIQELAPSTPSWLPSKVSIVILQDRASKIKWFWAVIHLPASVDGGNGVFRVHDDKNSDEFIRSQVKKWKAVMRHLPTVISASLKKYNIKRQNSIITADWNVNLAQSAWRQKMKTYFPNYKLSNPKGSAGTLGKRTIDASLVANEVSASNWRGLGVIPSSDHKPFVVEYKIP